MEMYLWYSCKFMQHGKDNQYNDDLKLFFLPTTWCIFQMLYLSIFEIKIEYYNTV